MQRAWHFAFAALACVAFSLTVPALASSGGLPATSTCAATTGDAQWFAETLSAWRRTAKTALGLDPRPLATLVLFDGHCSWRAEGTTTGEAKFVAEPHADTVTVPTGDQIPIDVTSFSSPYDHDSKAFLVMALPTIWQKGNVASDLTLAKLMTSVFIHESTHTRQFYAFAPLMTVLTKRWNLPDDLDDDTVQTRFKTVPDYVAAYQSERDLFFQAANAPSVQESATFARQAFDAMKMRRARWFTGADAKYADLEDAFLTLEGIGNWAAYAYLIDPQGGGFKPDFALPNFRRNGVFWSQDEGLAIFLTVDRLLPDWKQRAFAPNAATAIEMLTAALDGPARN